MKRVILGIPFLLVLMLPGDSYPHGPRGGGGVRGGGAARPSFQGHSPSFSPGAVSRPSMPSRPAGGAHSGLVPQNRPNFGGGGNRPNITPGNRPNFSPGNRPNITPGNRPDFRPDNRPNINPGNRPNLRPDNRPNVRPDFRPDNRPNLRPDNRPDFRPDNRPGLRPGVRPDININRPTNIIGSGNRPVIGSGNRAVIGSGNRANWNRNYWNRNYYHHGGWYHGGWNWYRSPAFWVAGAATAGWLMSPSYVYANPFYVPSTTVIEPALDYSQPIAVPPPVVQQTAVMPNAEPNLAAEETAVAAEAEPPPGQPVPEEATKQFDSARTAFKSGNYEQALRDIDKAIGVLPGDAVLHEFRGLVLFALKRYKEAAATVYAVMSAGPGWNWDTMKSLYPDEQTYTNQLRALEAYQREHPDSADAHFLLAYQYLVLDYPDQAAKQLEQVTKLLPSDKLSSELVKAIKEPSEERPNPG